MFYVLENFSIILHKTLQYSMKMVIKLPIISFIAFLSLPLNSWIDRFSDKSWNLLYVLIILIDLWSHMRWICIQGLCQEIISLLQPMLTIDYFSLEFGELSAKYTGGDNLGKNKQSPISSKIVITISNCYSVFHWYFNLQFRVWLEPHRVCMG